MLWIYTKNQKKPGRTSLSQQHLKEYLIKNMLNKIEVLNKCIEVRDLLSDPNAHTIKVFARNKVGYEVTINSSAACAFCFAGAISKVCNDHTGRSELYAAVHCEFMKEVNEELPGAKYVVSFNDHNTH